MGQLTIFFCYYGFININKGESALYSADSARQDQKLDCQDFTGCYILLKHLLL